MGTWTGTARMAQYREESIGFRLNVDLGLGLNSSALLEKPTGIQLYSEN